jgi:hypothetical protein
MRELTSDEVMLVSGGSQSNPWRVIVDKSWGKWLYKDYWKDAFDNAKNVRAGDEAAWAWLDAAWEAENNPPPEGDPAPAPAPAPTPVPGPSDLWIMEAGGGGGNWWDTNIHMH